MKRIWNEIRWWIAILPYWKIFFKRLFALGEFKDCNPVFGLGWKKAIKNPIFAIRYIWYLIKYFTNKPYFIGWNNNSWKVF